MAPAGLEQSTGPSGVTSRSGSQGSLVTLRSKDSEEKTRKQGTLALISKEYVKKKKRGEGRWWLTELSIDGQGKAVQVSQTGNFPCL